MAASLNKYATVAALLLVCSSLHAAEPLPDPTRPAAEFLTPGDGTVAVKAVVSDDGLRTIIIAPDRRSAVINGKQVPLGGKLGDERLMAVCEDSVVLVSAEGRREVPLYPGVVMQGNRIKRCNTPAAKTAAPVARKKLKTIKQKSPGSAAGKKEKTCE